MKIYEHNVETGEAAERDMTPAEIAQYDSDMANAEAAQEAAQTAKASAEAKLAALGLTLEDLKALGL
jgi:FMN-dependent NADH-azoreductase